MERLIRRTLPVSGDVNLVEEAPAPRGARHSPGAPAGARTARNPKPNPRKFNTPRPGGERTKGGAAANGERPAPGKVVRRDAETGKVVGAKPNGGKPRWTKGQRDAGRARRAAAN